MKNKFMKNFGIYSYFIKENKTENALNTSNLLTALLQNQIPKENYTQNDLNQTNSFNKPVEPLASQIVNNVPLFPEPTTKKKC